MNKKNQQIVTGVVFLLLIGIGSVVLYLWTTTDENPPIATDTPTTDIPATDGAMSDEDLEPVLLYGDNLPADFGQWSQAPQTRDTLVQYLQGLDNQNSGFGGPENIFRPSSERIVDVVYSLDTPVMQSYYDKFTELPSFQAVVAENPGVQLLPNLQELPDFEVRKLFSEAVRDQVMFSADYYALLSLAEKQVLVEIYSDYFDENNYPSETEAQIDAAFAPLIASWTQYFASVLAN